MSQKSVQINASFGFQVQGEKAAIWGNRPFILNALPKEKLIYETSVFIESDQILWFQLIMVLSTAGHTA